MTIERVINLSFFATNNEVEIPSQLQVKSDSQLVMIQFNGKFLMKEARLQEYLEAAKKCMTQFEKVEVEHIPWEQNIHAD